MTLYPVTVISLIMAITIRLCLWIAMNKFVYRKTHMTALVGRIIQAKALKRIIFRNLDLWDAIDANH